MDMVKTVYKPFGGAFAVVLSYIAPFSSRNIGNTWLRFGKWIRDNTTLVTKEHVKLQVRILRDSYAESNKHILHRMDVLAYQSSLESILAEKVWKENAQALEGAVIDSSTIRQQAQNAFRMAQQISADCQAIKEQLQQARQHKQDLGAQIEGIAASSQQINNTIVSCKDTLSSQSQTINESKEQLTLLEREVLELREKLKQQEEENKRLVRGVIEGHVLSKLNLYRQREIVSKASQLSNKNYSMEKEEHKIYKIPKKTSQEIEAVIESAYPLGRLPLNKAEDNLSKQNPSQKKTFFSKNFIPIPQGN